MPREWKRALKGKGSSLSPRRGEAAKTAPGGTRFQCFTTHQLPVGPRCCKSTPRLVLRNCAQQARRSSRLPGRGRRLGRTFYYRHSSLPAYRLGWACLHWPADYATIWPMQDGRRIESTDDLLG